MLNLLGQWKTICMPFQDPATEAGVIITREADLLVGPEETTTEPAEANQMNAKTQHIFKDHPAKAGEVLPLTLTTAKTV